MSQASKNDDVLARLDEIVARLDALEARLAPVGELIDEVPNAIATAVDTLDATVAARPDIPDRLRCAASLAERSTDPEVAEALHKGLDVVEGLEGMVAIAIDTVDATIAARPDLPERAGRAMALAERSTDPEVAEALHKGLDVVEGLEGMVATAIDTVDATIAARPDLPERAERAMALAERSTDPEVAEALHKGLDVVEGLEGMVATAIDTVDATIAAHPDIPERLERLLQVTERITNPDTMASLNKALDVLEGMEGMVATIIDVIDERLTRITDMHERIEAVERLIITFTQPGHLDTLCKVANASMHGAAGDAEPMTPWAAFKASREPEVQRALGIAINVARALGSETEHPLLAPAKTPS